MEFEIIFFFHGTVLHMVCELGNLGLAKYIISLDKIDVTEVGIFNFSLYLWINFSDIFNYISIHFFIYGILKSINFFIQLFYMSLANQVTSNLLNISLV